MTISLILAFCLIFSSISYSRLIKWSILPVMIHQWWLTTFLIFANPLVSLIFLFLNFKWYYAIAAFTIMLIVSNVAALPFIKLLTPRDYEVMDNEEIIAKGKSQIRHFLSKWVHLYLLVFMVLSVLVAIGWIIYHQQFER